MKKLFALALVVALLSCAVTLSLQPAASANPEGFMPQLSMPIEHINYTVAPFNGTLWAEIDGEYPIRIIGEEGCVFGELPMVYPMPPDTANIHVYLGDREVAWSNYTEAYPGELHHTALGDWWMIYAPLTGLSEDFTLRIHYEHPLESVNNSFLFLYDLNISPYLSEQSPSSTAVFTVRFDANITDVKVYTAPPNSPASQWQPKAYTTEVEGTTEVTTITMDSAYDTELVGDIVVEFSSLEGVAEFPVWAVFGLLALGLAAGLLFKKGRKQSSVAGLGKTSNQARTGL